MQRKLVERLQDRQRTGQQIYRTTCMGERVLTILLEAESLILGNVNDDQCTLVSPSLFGEWLVTEKR